MSANVWALKDVSFQINRPPETKRTSWGNFRTPREERHDSHRGGKKKSGHVGKIGELDGMKPLMGRLRNVISRAPPN